MRYKWVAVLGTEVTLCALLPMPGPPWQFVWGVCARFCQHSPGILYLSILVYVSQNGDRPGGLVS